MEIINSVLNIWHEYDLLVNLFSSIAAVYVSILVSYYLTLLALKFTLLKKASFIIFRYLNTFLKYFPLIIIGVFFLFIFPGSEFVEYMFLIIYAWLFLFTKASKPANIKEEYILSAQSMGLNNSTIVSKVLIKSIKPIISGNIIKLHVNLWTMLVALEFFKEGLGIGSVFKMTLDLNDLNSFLIISTLLVIIILAGSLSLRYIHKKFFFWEF